MPGKKQPSPQSPQNNSRTSSLLKASLQKTSATDFPVIGLGASAGGLDALKEFFSHVNKNSNMAYVVVVHLAPKQPSMLAELLENTTSIPVQTARDGQEIKANHAYVVPPDKDINMFQGKLQLLDKVPHEHPLPIDTFLRSLALDQGNKSAAIILSGTGSDGTLGVREIKSKDGLVLVQTEDSAGYDGMPRSAIGTGLVDMQLPPEKMPKMLVQYFSHIENHQHDTFFSKDQSDRSDWLNKIFAIMRSRLDVDFSVYKINTIARRINRRMGLNHITNHDEYVRFLRENPDEMKALFRELLIGVTSFFRDIKSFEALKAKALPPLFEQIPEDGTFRLWIPGCSTGEEVYSMAMILHEYLDTINKRVNLQLFGTDIDENAINKAREGLFPVSIVSDVSKKRLNRFFTKEGNYFRIRNEIRDCVVFSVQDVLKDPPFSRLDLLCCRNLLIYFNAEAQKKVLPLFHYTLNPGGILVLGSSESIGIFTNLFQTIDKKWKIFKRLEVPKTLNQQVYFPSGLSVSDHVRHADQSKPAARKYDIGMATMKAVADQFAPAAVLIDDSGSILHIQGKVGKYLEPPSGPPTQNVLDLARTGLRIELSSALRKAKTGNETIVRKGIAVKTNGDKQLIDLHVCPQEDKNELAGRFLVVFKDVDEPATLSRPQGGNTKEIETDDSRIATLEKEVQLNWETHQTTVEELESSNEELKSTNEELQSSNEELQSTNEELESSKEEMQSLNEELQTVNAELQSKLEELSAAQDDMRNIFNSTEIATIFVDNEMRVRRFTAEATKIVNLIQSDIGRPLEHVKNNLNQDSMITDMHTVLKTLVPIDAQVQTNTGKWYKMRIMPYRTMDNRIQGLVLTFSNIDSQIKEHKKLETFILEVETSLELARTVFNMNSDPLLVLDEAGKIVIANVLFSELVGSSLEDILEKDILKIAGGKLKNTPLASELENAVDKKSNFVINKVELDTKDHKQKFTINGRIIRKNADYPYRILLHFMKIA